VPASTDEGYDLLVDHAPTIEKMRDVFREFKERFERNINAPPPLK
jgi:hypothetical protein